MKRNIKTVYVIHHSHTDVGYTDLQERVIDNQVDYIHTVLNMMKKPEYKDFRWNCETLFCVEEFFKEASDEEKAEFCRLAGEGKVGLSANYLNFNDLVDKKIYEERLGEWQKYFGENNCAMKTAMFADINGISMGYRDAMIEQGIEFLYTNIHCHHGMYPLYQNQTAFWWENEAGKKMLVWNGEHYNLGNVLGFQPSKTINFMQQNYLGKDTVLKAPVETLHENLITYLDSCEEQGYKYNFIISSVSGVFSDNAPPSPLILEIIEEFNRQYGEEVQVRMVSLQELYEAVADDLADAPVYHGDMTDWWANGIGSTPYAVKHYREAQHVYHLCERLEPDAAEKYPELWRTAQDNLLLYAEHTWGHSSTITNPYDTMVLNLDMRKNSYASKAHEATARVLNHIMKERGDLFRYYNTDGTIKVLSVSKTEEPQLIEFYIETMAMPNAEITDENGRNIPCQVSPHPRGRKISFADILKPGEEKMYTYRCMPAEAEIMNTRQCYMGAERIRDVVNSYDTETYHLPYYYENKFFRLSYETGTGITSFIDRRTGKEMLGCGEAPFFTPMYEVTRVRKDLAGGSCPEEWERRIMGRNIRGTHAELYKGQLKEIEVQERGKVFTELRLKYALEGTVHADVILKFYADMPRIDFRLELGKTISSDIESIFLPMSIDFENNSLYLKKGAETFRPGVDQLPGTCMEYYASDEGIVYQSSNGGAVIAAHDTPLFYMGEMKHHPVLLCDGKEENNHRPVYSWVMNNDWETNFKMDLSGFGEYKYTLWLDESANAEDAMNLLKERTFDPYVLIIK